MLHSLHRSKRGPFRSGRKYFIFINVVFIIINYLQISCDLKLGDIKNPRIIIDKVRTKDIFEILSDLQHILSL